MVLNYCQSCGTQMLQTMRLCPQCGGRVFSSAPPVRASKIVAEVRGATGVPQPRHEVSFSEAASLFFRNYANFEGRSSRAAFWWWVLCAVLVSAALGLLLVSAAQSGPGAGGAAAFIYLGFGFATLIPGIALNVRRLHDTDKSGWWLLLGIVPFAGIILFIFFCLPGTTGPNRFGPDAEAGRKF